MLGSLWGVPVEVRIICKNIYNILLIISAGYPLLCVRNMGNHCNDTIIPGGFPYMVCGSLITD